jgi:hypothetical protein
MYSPHVLGNTTVHCNNLCRSLYMPGDGPVWPKHVQFTWERGLSDDLTYNSVKLHWRLYCVCVSIDQLLQQDAQIQYYFYKCIFKGVIKEKPRRCTLFYPGGSYFFNTLYLRNQYKDMGPICVPNFIIFWGEQILCLAVVVFHGLIVHLFASRWIKLSAAPGQVLQSL